MSDTYTISVDTEVELSEHVNVYQVKDSKGNESEAFDWSFDGDGDIILTISDCVLVTHEEYQKLQLINLIEEE